MPDTVPPALADWFCENQVVPFLGAAASRVGIDDTSAPPDSSKLATILLRSAGGIGGVSNGDGLARVAQAVQYQLDRRSVLDTVRDAVCCERIATVPRFLAKVPWTNDRPGLIVTTNYDDQLERAFLEQGRPLCVITHVVDDAEKGPNQLHIARGSMPPKRMYAKELVLRPDFVSMPRETVFLYKIHGDLCSGTAETDDVILTEDDYIRFLGAMNATSGSLPPQAISAELSVRRLLFLGYALEDWNLRLLLRTLQRQLSQKEEGGFSHYAVLRDASTVDRLIWSNRNVRVIEGELSEFVSKVGDDITRRVGEEG